MMENDETKKVLFQDDIILGNKNKKWEIGDEDRSPIVLACASLQNCRENWTAHHLSLCKRFDTEIYEDRKQVRAFARTLFITFYN